MTSTMPQPETIATVLNRASARLAAAGIANDVLDAQALLAHTLGKDRTYLIINFNETLSPERLQAFDALIARRCAGEPLQYITGHQEFFGLAFEVTPAVLIPRPETELIIEKTIRLAQQHLETQPDWQPVIIDVGTGSGCIAVTLARELGQMCQDVSVIATDISADALALAKHNALRHALTGRIEFRQGDLLSEFPPEPLANFIISNPPYIAAQDMPTLQREVRDHEPHIALTDFADGLEFYRRLFAQSPSRLCAGGWLICEMGYGQSEKILSLVDRKIWNEPHLLEDLQAIARILALQKL
jgi:release factor glutamine methyltransferase